MTVDEFIKSGWTPPHPEERIRSLIEIRDFVMVFTDSRIYRASTDHNGNLMVYLIGHF